MRLNFHWHTYQYFPYEQKLAHRELVKLMGNEPIPRTYGFSVDSSGEWKTHAYRTTYFREVIAEDGSRVIPLQAALEASANGEVQFGSRSEDMHVSLRRQSTRYSAHGIHEYRGKFNPQIVRVIGNILGLRPEDWLLDPFCGSGTSLLEAAHLGWNAIGVDLNPLAIEIALAKITAMQIQPKVLRVQTEKLSQLLRKKFANISLAHPFSQHQMREIDAEHWEDQLPNLGFLRKWFRESVLVQLSVILDEISRVSSEEVQLIIRVFLSDILRKVSLQDPGDLRIRRRKSAPKNAPAISIFIDSMTRKVERILKAREHIPVTATIQDAVSGDSRCCATAVKAHPEARTMQQFDAAITSPPYATALPYINTQRLSLALLGLVSSGELHATQKSLIGSREISANERLSIEAAMETNANQLPSECMSFCIELKKSVDKDNDGFRRQNKPALVYKYLSDMAPVFAEVHQLLRKGACFVLIIGQNKTRLGGRWHTIDNSRLLTLLAEDRGFELLESIELNTYQRFDMHRLNSIRSENMIVLRAM